MSGHNGVVQMGMAMLQKEATPFVGLSIKMLAWKTFLLPGKGHSSPVVSEWKNMANQ